jgi:hypothetical protein
VTIATTGTYHDELAHSEQGWLITHRDITPG